MDASGRGVGGKNERCQGWERGGRVGKRQRQRQRQRGHDRRRVSNVWGTTVWSRREGRQGAELDGCGCHGARGAGLGEIPVIPRLPSAHGDKNGRVLLMSVQRVRARAAGRSRVSRQHIGARQRCRGARRPWRPASKGTGTCARVPRAVSQRRPATRDGRRGKKIRPNKK